LTGLPEGTPVHNGPFDLPATAMGAGVKELGEGVIIEMAELYYRTRLAGEPLILGPDRIAEVRAKISNYGQSKS
jgi:hypothetical protein